MGLLDALNRSPTVEELRETFADQIRQAVLDLEEGEALEVKCCARDSAGTPDPLFLITFKAPPAAGILPDDDETPFAEPEGE